MITLGNGAWIEEIHLMLPTLGQLITPTTDVAVDQNYEIRDPRLRRIKASARVGITTTSTINCRALVLEVYGADSTRLLGATRPSECMSTFIPLSDDAGREGWYLPYPPADGIAIPATTEAPVNQVPYERDFLNHCLHVRS